ncbi:MAG: sigma 54-interacting transcriptional regulator [Bacillus sp. (in: Bacteria)]|nr:sigma 54-interacting transcriptional regulator [Bacillus sp. (in: firmicutes)]
MHDDLLAVFSEVLNNIDEGIHLVDPYGYTVFYNDVSAKYDGLHSKEVLGKHVLDVFPSLTKETSTLLKVLTTKKPIVNQVQSYVNFHGKWIETVNTTIPLFVKGKLAGAVEIARDYSKLKQLNEKLIDLHQQMKKTTNRTEVSTSSYHFHHIITKHQPLLDMIQFAKKLAVSESPVLVVGESGTGKELFVQGIHHSSLRRDQPFIAQNCAALPESLLESILFGTAKGSYTGAVERPGLFELADGGTLFLDEIHTMPIALQAKLLRVLEDGLVRRVGALQAKKVNVRIIGALNISPLEAVENNQLRLDLYYRLNVLMFELPPLRHRTEDVPLLVEAFINEWNRKLGKKVRGMIPSLLSFFQQYEWPGNVRELKHTVEYMMNVCEDEWLEEHHLPPLLLKRVRESYNFQSVKQGRVKQQEEWPVPLQQIVQKTEKEWIEKALQKVNGNVKQAAKLLQIPRQTLQYKIGKYKIHVKEFCANI